MEPTNFIRCETLSDLAGKTIVGNDSNRRRFLVKMERPTTVRSSAGYAANEVNPAAQSRIRKELVACLKYDLLVWMSTRTRLR